MNRQKNKVNMEKVFATVISLSIMVALVVGIVSILKSNKSGNEDKKNYIDLNQMGESNGYADGVTDGAANGTNNSYANSEAPTEKETALHASGGEGTSNGNEKQTTEPNKTADGKNNGNDKQPSGTKPDETGKAADNGNKVPSSGSDTNAAQGDAGSGEKDVAASSGNEGTKNEGDAADSQQVAANSGGAANGNVPGENGAPEGSAQGNNVADADNASGNNASDTDNMSGNNVADADNASGNNVADANDASGVSGQTQSSDSTPENSDFVWGDGTQTAQGEAGEDGNGNNITGGEDVSGGTAPVNAATASLLGYNFGPESTLMWPTQGDVILNYNMANTVYFPTLDMYRCNPAIIIRAEEGAVVCAATDGIVMDVKEYKDTGLTVKIAVGNEYVLTYGQLKDLVVGIGSQVRRGDVIGSVAAPSQYYSVEGANLYFRVDDADGPVNPMDFIEAQ